MNDRLGQFDNYANDNPKALRRMSKIFSMACAALSAVTNMDDDRRTHRVTATIPSATAYPVRLRFTLQGMSSPSGWTVHRSVGIWMMGSWRFSRGEVEEVSHLPETRELRVSVAATAKSHDTIIDDIDEVGREIGGNVLLDLCVKLGRAAVNANPAFETISRMHLTPSFGTASTASVVMNTVYGLTPLGCRQADEPTFDGDDEDIRTIMINRRLIAVTDDQQQALALGNARYPIIGIQAAFGTGKTVVGAYIAVRHASRGQRVVVTASTNTAVSQFTETILSLDEFSHVGVVRFIAETIAFDDIATTAVDMHEVLKSLGSRFADRLSTSERRVCDRFTTGRTRYERYKRGNYMELTEQEKDDFMMAEQDVCETLEAMIELMFRLVAPRIICITTSSLLNTTDKGGIFKGYVNTFDLLIGDEASQIPEPVFMAIASRLEGARHIYIGDVRQLEPYARCSRLANPARFGARSIIDTLLTARAVPIAPLVTTFRAHPALNSLPNTFAYEGTLVNGIRAVDRQLLAGVVRFPNPAVPFAFVDVKGTSA
ncbi:hypothetical protein ANCCEY_07900 [Ancylostoma ceylanicum]|uniref:DNA2/NAM7 helicase helicase domain-containing protein n=1 Tax=Ancylostoma ceylanicum TaxID=53326 RepID=A0A0D6LMD2_9BILA|nr:hypothetical protein ANCCEY_07900 [Ancylostoma ceylanicum]